MTKYYEKKILTDFSQSPRSTVAMQHWHHLLDNTEVNEPEQWQWKYVKVSSPVGDVAVVYSRMV